MGPRPPVGTCCPWDRGLPTPLAVVGWGLWEGGHPGPHEVPGATTSLPGVRQSCSSAEQPRAQMLQACFPSRVCVLQNGWLHLVGPEPQQELWQLYRDNSKAVLVWVQRRGGEQFLVYAGQRHP